MKFSKFLSLSFISSSILFSSFVFDETYAAEEYRSDVIINFNTDIDYSLLSLYDADIIYDYENIHSVYASIPDRNINALVQSIKIDSVDKNKSVNLSNKDNDSLVLLEDEIQFYNANKNYAQDKVHAKEAWDKGVYGKGIKIAIIDSGIDLKNNIEVTPKKTISFVTETNGDNSVQDYDGHGTLMASLIAGTHKNDYVNGLAPEADIYVAKVLDGTGTGYYSTIIQAIDWAISEKVDIINLSLGNSVDDQSVHNAIQKASEQGIIIVAGSGNNGLKDASKNTMQYPAKYEEVIAVGATNKNDMRGQFSKGTYSATGNELDFVAPGVYNVGLGLNGDYVYSSGTSNSTAITSGVIALYLESNKTVNAKNIKDILAYNATDLGDAGKDNIFGFGLIKYSTSTKFKPVKASFSDVPTDHWAFNSISFVQHYGIMKGKNSLNTFKPDDLLTRAEASAIFNRAIGYKSSENLPANPFKDLSKNHWAYNEVLTASKHQLFSGYEDGSFKADSNITRAEIASVLNRVVSSDDIDVSKAMNFSDVPSNHWAFSSIKYVFQNNVFNGYEDGTFKPSNNITRAEMASVITKSYKQLEKH